MKKLSIALPTKEITKQSQNTLKREKNSSTDLNFKVDAEFKRDFKSYAVMHDLTQKQVLELAFKLLKENSI